MTLVFLQYPSLCVLLALSVLLSLLAARRKGGNLLLTLLSVLCVVGMVILALSCMVPYTEILILLLVPALVCLLAIGKEGQA